MKRSYRLKIEIDIVADDDYFAGIGPAGDLKKSLLQLLMDDAMRTGIADAGIVQYSIEAGHSNRSRTPTHKFTCSSQLSQSFGELAQTIQTLSPGLIERVRDPLDFDFNNPF